MIYSTSQILELKDGVCVDIDECSEAVESHEYDRTNGSCIDNELATYNLNRFTCACNTGHKLGDDKQIL